MSFMRLYLVGYYLLLAGAVLALWQADVLGRIPLAWISMGLLVAVGLGILVAVTSTRPPVRLE